MHQMLLSTAPWNTSFTHPYSSPLTFNCHTCSSVSSIGRSGKKPSRRNNIGSNSCGISDSRTFYPQKSTLSILKSVGSTLVPADITEAQHSSIDLLPSFLTPTIREPFTRPWNINILTSSSLGHHRATFSKDQATIVQFLWWHEE